MKLTDFSVPLLSQKNLSQLTCRSYVVLGHYYFSGFLLVSIIAFLVETKGFFSLKQNVSIKFGVFLTKQK